MALPLIASQPKHSNYDIVIIGGAMLGSSLAWFLSANPDFNGSVLVLERDPTYQFSATALTNSCMRQQFSAEINIKISQFAADFVKNFQVYMGNDPRVPKLVLHSFGYMYLANTPKFAETLRLAQREQHACGAGTKHMTPAEIAGAYPFYRLDDILAANHKDRKSVV